ncbi:MAG: 6-carboxytetrahydropterin synthase QueD [Proteobacteria bacterium]|nr:6-carboxytetrahydropterin synthase QueD [Pseudomonadota bacterium]
MYTLVVNTHFSSAHKLRGYQGECEELHGHNWKVVVRVSGETLDHLGMVLDFKVLKQKINDIVQKLDHSYLNEIPPFDAISPSSENIACYLFKELKKAINDEKISMSQVKVWESENYAAIYSE